MIGAITGLIGAGLQAYTQYQQNKGIKDIMGKIKAPSTEGVDIARKGLAQAQLAEQAQAPGTLEAEKQIARNAASTVSTAERAGENPLLTAAAAATQANEAQTGLAKAQADYKLSAAAQRQQAGQVLSGAISQQEQAYNNYLQSLISAKSSLGQGTASALGGLTSLGGGLESNAAYLLGTGKFTPKTLPWYYK